MDKDINNNIDIDEDEDIEEIIEPNKYIEDNYEYMNDYDEEERAYYSSLWNKKEYNINNFTNNIVIKSKKKKKKNKKVKNLLNLEPKYKYMFDLNLIPWKYREIKKNNNKDMFTKDDFPSL